MKILMAMLFMQQVCFAGAALVEALNSGQLEKVKQLAGNRSHLDYVDENGYDALYHAVSLNELQAVKQLIQAGSKLDRVYDPKKESILFEASRLGSQKMIEALIKKNPKLLTTKNTLNETVLFEAVRSEQSHLVKFYVTKGLSLQDRNTQGKTPIEYLTPENTKMKQVLKQLEKKRN